MDQQAKHGGLKIPGPSGLPFVGYLPFLGRAPHEHLWQLVEKYGDIYQVNMASSPAIILSDPKLIREAFKQEAFSARPDMFLRDDILQNRGLVLTDGDKWKEQRRFAMLQLRRIASSQFGVDNIGAQIHREMQDFLAFLNTTDTKAIDLRHILHTNVGNVISTIVCGQRFQYEDIQFQKCLQNMEEGFEMAEWTTLFNFFPRARFVPGMNQFYQTINTNHKNSCDFFQKLINQHIDDLDLSEPPRDFIDAYLHEISKRNETDHIDHSFTDPQMLQSVIDLFGAGMETTKSSLLWAFLYMAANPDKQRLVQEELDRVLPEGEFPSMNILKQLPYTEATLHEVQRMASVVPLGVPHAADRNVLWKGYYIPKGTWLLANIWGINHDEKFWSNPHQFQPERFLNEDKQVHKPDYFIPFSVGRRMCIGEPLARMNVSFIFASVVQNFFLEIPEEYKISYSASIGVSLNPKPYRLCMTRRKVLPTGA